MIRNKKTTMTALVLGSCLAFMACDKTEEELDEESTTTSGTPVAGGGAYKDTSTTKVSNMNALPSLSQMFEAGDASALMLAATGTPPALPDIAAATHIGSGASLLADINTAKDAENWSTVIEKAKAFQQLRSKCQAFEDGARSIQDVMQQGTSMCYMQKIDGAGLMTIADGSNESYVDGSILASEAATKVVRMAIVNDPHDPSGENPFVIYFKIHGTDDVGEKYKAELHFCRGDTEVNDGIEIIEADNEAGKLSINSIHGGSETYEGEEQSHKFTAQIACDLVANAAGDAYECDSSADRVAYVNGSNSSASNSGTRNAVITLTTDAAGNSVMESKMVGTWSFVHNGTTMSSSNKGAAIALFSGLNANTLAIYEGAAKQAYSFTNHEGNSETRSETTAYEFNENSAPNYSAISSSGFLTTISTADRFNFSTDAFLASTAPTAPDTTLMNDSLCGSAAADVDAKYTLDMSNQAFMAIGEACENHFEGADQWCNDFRQNDSSLWEAVNLACQNGTCFDN